jgi:NitT/TauT family transport system permease protein
LIARTPDAIPIRGAPRRRRLWIDILIPIVLLLLVFVGWELAVVVFDFPPYVMPRPADVLKRLWEERSNLWDDAVATFTVAFVGLALSVIIGVPIGLAMGRWRRVRRVLMPPMVAVQSIPKVALAPLFVVWLGFGALPKLIIAVLITFFPLVLATVVGVEAVPLPTAQVARSMGIRRTRFLRSILLPASAPYVAAAFRTSATLAVVGALVAEFVGSENGLGNYLLIASGNRDTEAAFAAIVVIALGGIVFYAIAAVLARLATVHLGPTYMEGRIG